MTQLIHTTTESLTIARSQVVGKVLGLVGVAFLFTAVGAVIGLRTGSPHWLVWLAGGLGLLWLLRRVKERSPYNLLALYAFATWMGVGLAPLLGQYLARELGNLLVEAAAATAVVAVAAGTYGITTQRDLSSLGHLLFADSSASSSLLWLAWSCRFPCCTRRSRRSRRCCSPPSLPTT